jgi:hypothetical protein
MTARVEAAREVGDEKLGSAVSQRRDGDERRSDESDVHGIG